MGNDGLDGNGLQNGFLKTVQDKLFSKSNLACTNVVTIRNTLRKIAFYHFKFSRVFLSCYSINLGIISSIYKSFEQIHRDTAPLIGYVCEFFIHRLQYKSYTTV